MEIMYTNEFSYTTPSQFEAVLNINGRRWIFAGALLNNGGVHWRSLCKVQDKYLMYDGMGMSSDSPNLLAWWLESKSFGRNWKAVKLWFVPEPELINEPEQILMAKRATIAAGYPDGVSIAPKRRERRGNSDFCKSCGKGVVERTPCITVQKTTNGRCEAAYHHLPNCCKDLQPIADEVMAAVEESPYSEEEKEKLRDMLCKVFAGEEINFEGDDSSVDSDSVEFAGVVDQTNPKRKAVDKPSLSPAEQKAATSALKKAVQSAGANGKVNQLLLQDAVEAGYTRGFVVEQAKKHWDSVKDLKPPSQNTASKGKSECSNDETNPSNAISGLNDEFEFVDNEEESIHSLRVGQRIEYNEYKVGNDVGGDRVIATVTNIDEKGTFKGKVDVTTSNKYAPINYDVNVRFRLVGKDNKPLSKWTKLSKMKRFHKEPLQTLDQEEICADQRSAKDRCISATPGGMETAAMAVAASSSGLRFRKEPLPTPVAIGEVGYCFRKQFDDGWYVGKIVDIRRGASKQKDRRCVYTDGDREDLSMKELQTLATLESKAEEKNPTEAVIESEDRAEIKKRKLEQVGINVTATRVTRSRAKNDNIIVGYHGQQKLKK
jgi:hypothetical protein